MLLRRKEGGADDPEPDACLLWRHVAVQREARPWLSGSRNAKPDPGDLSPTSSWPICGVGQMKNRTIVIAAIAAAAGASFTFVGLTYAQSAQSDASANVATEFSDAQAQDIRKIVEAYIRDNPEVMIESINAYAAQEEDLLLARQEAAQSEAAVYLASDEDAFAAGRAPEKARVAVVEFFDYHCGFCKRASGLVRDLAKSDEDVKVVFRELPILKRESEIAARYALAARDQGKYLDFHFALMRSSGTLTEDRILDIAKKNGLELDALRESAESEAVRVAVDRQRTIASEIGVDGTPGFIIATTDGSHIDLVPGFAPDRVLEAVKKAKEALKADK